MLTDVPATCKELLEFSQTLREESRALLAQVKTDSERVKEIVAAAKHQIELIRTHLFELSSKPRRGR